jgi:formiminotetrahydrofolate cyclodeaminase
MIGAIGIALGNMVGGLTVGKKKYADVQDCIKALKANADRLQAELLDLVRRDAEAFEPLSKAYGMPAETSAEKFEKARIMENALRQACEPPLEIMRKCCEGIEFVKEFAAKGAAIAISDAGCGAVCLKAALQAASLNVFINTKSMKDRAYAEEINGQAGKLLEAYTVMADNIYEKVSQRFK